MLNKRERNKIYEAIVQSELDPAEFDLKDTGDKVVVSHNSGSTFEFSFNPALAGGTPRRLIDKIQASAAKYRYEYRAKVADGVNQTGTANSISSLESDITYWLDEIRQTVGVPDYWEELKRSQGSIAVIRHEDFGNTPFTEDEQRQISAQVQKAKKHLEQFALSNEQESQIAERLDELVEASHHLGRKDWLIIFITTISPLVVGDIVTPGVARHIFTIVINGLIHLFGGGPPQILT